jgi:hypothetical protein
MMGNIGFAIWVLFLIALLAVFPAFVVLWLTDRRRPDRRNSVVLVS